MEEIRISKTAFSPAYIMENGIENYIEPGCINPCLELWRKNIYTFESSNNSSYSYAWIDLLDLSEENFEIYTKLVNENRAGVNPFTNNYCLIAPLGENAEKYFLKSISDFKIQDISPRFYQTETDFLETAKRQGGNYKILEDGTIERIINPSLTNLTFSDALKESGKEDLYDQNSHRVFEDKMSLEGYLKYLNSTKEIKR